MKILYVTTIGGTMGFFRSLIKELIESGNTVDIATNNIVSTKVPDYFSDIGCRVFQIDCSRNVFGRGNITAIHQIKRIVKDNDYDVVHCHTPIASVCTRIACSKFRKKGLKVIYTSHGFQFYKGGALKNWLLFFPIELICSIYTDILIAINGEDYAIAKKYLRAKSTWFVNGVGIDDSKFMKPNISREEKRKELGIPKDAFVMISVGELNNNKNHKVIINAVAKLKNNRVHYIIAGDGPLYEYLKDLSINNGVSDKIHLLGYRTDIAELLFISDLVVFPSIREGLGMGALEGMAAGLPLLCSDNRGTRSYAVDHGNSIVCNTDDVDAFATGIVELMENKALYLKCQENALETSKHYSKIMINRQMMEIYNGING